LSFFGFKVGLYSGAKKYFLRGGIKNKK